MLTKIPFFSDMNNEELSKVEKILIKRTYPPNTIIFSEGESAKGFYIIDSGRVKVFKLSPEGKEYVLHTFESGEMFAEAAMFSGTSYPASAETLQNTTLIYVPKEAFLGLIRQYPELSFKMLGSLSIRLRRFAGIIEDLYLKEVSSRLAKYLLDMSIKAGSDSFKLDIKKTELAVRLGMARETLSRAFKKFRDKKIISLNKREVCILNNKLIQEAASGIKI